MLTNCYKDATDSGFHFEHDAFGGYGLFHGGDDLYVKKKKDFLLPALHALLQTVNDEDVDMFEPVSIFARTDLCKKKRIMVGPVRFANHSCKPNSEYVASSYKGHQCVRLRALQNIRRGQEITVYYGANFFDTGNWNCSCEHVVAHAKKPSVFSEKQLKLISANLEKRFVQKSRRDRSALPTKKQKFSEMRDFSSESCSDESSFVDDCATTDHFLSEPEPQIRDETSERYGVNTQNESPSEASFNDDQNATEDRISSNYAPETDMRSSHCHESEPKASNNDEKSSSDGFEEAIDFGSVTEQNLVTAIHSICAKHGTSDQELKDWLALKKTAFPNSYVPSFRKVKSMYNVPAKLQENCLKK